MARSGFVRSSTHWGVYDVQIEAGRPVKVTPFQDDPDPSDIGQSLLDAVDHPVRIDRPYIRRGWLERGRAADHGIRGDDSFVPVGWDEALDLAAAEIGRVIETHGNGAIFGGSYGWASAGRFHHAQSQVHRFLNTLGGYVRHVGSYSLGAADVIVPHVLGVDMGEMLRRQTPSWSIIAEHTELMVMFGGIGRKNAQVNDGGCTRHRTRAGLESCRKAGVRFVSISPSRSDSWEGIDAEWMPIRPSSDVALMLAIAYVLETEDLCDRGFLDKYTEGYDRFRPYLLGLSDGHPKTPEWAENLTGIGADSIAELARRMASSRCVISVSWSLQRAEFGEQPYWMAITLAAMLGQIGLPGGGIGFGYGVIDSIGSATRPLRGLAFPQGRNAVDDFIPVARIADMLLNPGATYRFNGETRTYPDIRLVYWCGGNPFHHHQDLNRLQQAWQKPDTIIVNESWWTATAKRADIVFPAAMMLERNDIGRTTPDAYLIAMPKAIEPFAKARTDYDIFAGLAARLGREPDFTQGRSEWDWLETLYAEFRNGLADAGIPIPSISEFWDSGTLRLPIDGPEQATIGFADFRSNPVSAPLATPSGKIEIFSDTIASFRLNDCPGHAMWQEPREWLGAQRAQDYPLHLMSPQPAGKLHSQLDFGRTSIAGKENGRECVSINSNDADTRRIKDGDTVRIFNDRGACLATARVTDQIMPGVASLPTGAWFDPISGGRSTNDTPLENSGNPNVLTQDLGTSELAQGCTAHSTLVEIELYDGPAQSPVHSPPRRIAR